MKREKFEKWYAENYKKGTYVVLEKATIKGDFVKVTKMVTRFVNYYNMDSVIAKGKSENASKPRDYEQQIIPHILKLNTNTNNLLLCVYKTYHHHAKSTYYFGDKEISEEDYYLMSGDKKRDYNDTPVFNMKLEDIISVGGQR